MFVNQPCSRKRETSRRWTTSRGGCLIAFQAKIWYLNSLNVCLSPLQLTLGEVLLLRRRRAVKNLDPWSLLSFSLVKWISSKSLVLLSLLLEADEDYPTSMDKWADEGSQSVRNSSLGVFLAIWLVRHIHDKSRNKFQAKNK